MKRKVLLIGLILCLGLCPVYSQSISDTKCQDCKTNSAQCIDKLYGNYDNQVKIIFSDIDGTILGLNKKCPRPIMPEKVKQTVRELQEEKLPFVLVTGRSYTEARDMANDMGYKGDYVVSLQGAEITNSKGELIYTDSIKHKDAEAIFKSINKFKKDNKMNYYTYLFVNGKVYSIDGVKLPYNWESLTYIKSFKDFDKNYACGKILIYETNPEKIRQVQKYLKEKFPEYRIDIAADCYCDITSPTATKGNAVKKLAQIYGIDLKNTAVFGDAENDLSMFELVKNAGGIGVATGNAMQILKQNSNYVTLDVWDCGFSKGVDEIIKNNERLDRKVRKDNEKTFTNRSDVLFLYILGSGSTSKHEKCQQSD